MLLKNCLTLYATLITKLKYNLLERFNILIYVINFRQHMNTQERMAQKFKKKQPLCIDHFGFGRMNIIFIRLTSPFSRVEAMIEKGSGRGLEMLAILILLLTSATSRTCHGQGFEVGFNICYQQNLSRTGFRSWF